MTLFETRMREMRWFPSVMRVLATKRYDRYDRGIEGVFEQLQIVTLFVGVVGTLAAPGTPGAIGGTSEIGFTGRDIITKEAEMISLPLPGTENLEEKAIPLSKLVSQQLLPPTGQDSLSENSRLSSELPGTENLAEKRIPVPILEKLYQGQELDRPSV